MIVPQTVLWETLYLTDIELGDEEYIGEHLSTVEFILWIV